MKAIFNHELDSYYHNITAYVFSALLLLFVGLFAMVYNINGAVANFEYVLAGITMSFILIIPLLTMRSFTEERRQKTDQLLYSLPLEMSDIVWGKYLTMLAVYAFPLLIMCVYPLIFSRFGNVYLPTSYGSLAALFFMGAAFIAIGMFISALTEKLTVSAGITALVVLANYFSVKFADSLTGKVGEFLANIIYKLSLFSRFNNFINGVFDVNSIVFYISVAGLFVFLCVQALEKRRYS